VELKIRHPEFHHLSTLHRGGGLKRIELKRVSLNRDWITLEGAQRERQM
jgi:hypothetical protein